MAETNQEPKNKMNDLQTMSQGCGALPDGCRRGYNLDPKHARSYVRSRSPSSSSMYRSVKGSRRCSGLGRTLTIALIASTKASLGHASKKAIQPFTPCIKSSYAENATLSAMNCLRGEAEGVPL